jgi:hypothetical protein
MTEKLSLSEWRERQQARRATVKDTLPSGLEVERRQHLSLEAMAFKGHLPLGLLSGLVDQADDDGKLALAPADIIANVPQYGGLIDAVFQAAMVNPAIGDDTDLEADPPVLALSEFDELMGDKLYILEAVMGEVEELRPFRGESEEQAPDGTAAHNGSGVRAETVEAAGDPG